jgi:hypothetical protein
LKSTSRKLGRVPVSAPGHARTRPSSGTQDRPVDDDVNRYELVDPADAVPRTNRVIVERDLRHALAGFWTQAAWMVGG